MLLEDKKTVFLFSLLYKYVKFDGMDMLVKAVTTLASGLTAAGEMVCSRRSASASFGLALTRERYRFLCGFVSVDSAVTAVFCVVRFPSSVLHSWFSAFPFFLRLRYLAGQRCGNGFCRITSSSYVLDRGTGASLSLPYFCIYG